MFDSIRNVEPAVAAIRKRYGGRPRAALVLGSGLGELGRQIEVEASFPYESIPHFTPTTAPGHHGQLVCGTLAGVSVAAMAGRVHAYEGRPAQEITFGVRVMKSLGAEVLVLSNACGGLNPNYRPGDIVVVEDHINFTFANPLVGRHDTTSSVAYPDMSRPYDRELADRAMAAGRRHHVVTHRGVYVGVVGPNYETRAEHRMLRRIGADAVGMSTVLETIVAVQCKLRVLALAVVTNMCLPDRPRSTDASEVLAVAATAEPRVRAIVLEVLSSLRHES